MKENQKIVVVDAQEHNLKHLHLSIPRDCLTVITGVSGSGKSSLAFDTLFAEGQRKYMESLSSYARQFLRQTQKPKVEKITGLPPTIAIEQRAASHNPRSTIATSTEIYDYLRLLFARCGQPRCWKKNCKQLIQRQSAQQIIQEILKLPKGSRLTLLAPMVRGKKGYHKDCAEKLQKEGFVRARVNGKILDLYEDLSEDKDNPFSLKRYEAHTIEAVVARMQVSKEKKMQLADSVETALKIGHGVVIVATQEKKDDPSKEFCYSEHFACPDHPECNLQEMEPRLFSFNSPFGACPSCSGLGTLQEFDPLLILDPSLSLSEGAIFAFRKLGHMYQRFYNRLIIKACRRFNIDRNVPFQTLTKQQQDLLLHGKKSDSAKLSFTGVLPLLHLRFHETENANVRERLGRMLVQSPCPDCQGARLKIEALHVFLEDNQKNNLNIHHLASMTIKDAQSFFQNIQLKGEKKHIAKPIVKEISSRIGFLQSVGLGYLNLSRLTSTLSGGEAQRIRLATQIGTGLVGVCYILDEPTIGLHQRDNAKLIETLKKLSSIGNTVIVVEHDEEMIRTADHLIDMGPGPGVFGGEVIYQGKIEDIHKAPQSLTGKYLSGKEGIYPPKNHRKLSQKNLLIKGAHEHNLKHIDVSFPLGGITCVTGVSGSGKSTLVNDILVKALQGKLNQSPEKAGKHKELMGWEEIGRLICVDQSPIGKTPRSNPATYTGAFDLIRQLFSQSKQAQALAYTPGRFSFNVKGGRCEECQGQGTKKIEMHFLPDVYVNCESCQGTRYNRETLLIYYRRKNIADILNMSVQEALDFFKAHEKIHRILQGLSDVGLDYIQLGQSSTSLSGGEAQRVKLATELCKTQRHLRNTNPTLYVLDEPTTGLHFADIKKLIHVFNRLADMGHNLIIIEHNLDVIQTADWIIDLGPEGGDEGGRILCEGPPKEIMRCKKSHTAKFLKEHIKAKKL